MTTKFEIKDSSGLTLISDRTMHGMMLLDSRSVTGEGSYTVTLDQNYNINQLRTLILTNPSEVLLSDLIIPHVTSLSINGNIVTVNYSYANNVNTILTWVDTYNFNFRIETVAINPPDIRFYTNSCTDPCAFEINGECYSQTSTGFCSTTWSSLAETINRTYTINKNQTLNRNSTGSSTIFLMFSES